MSLRRPAVTEKLFPSFIKMVVMVEKTPPKWTGGHKQHPEYNVVGLS